MCWSNERGQSIVIIAFAMMGLLLFAGLALDAGVIYSGLVNLNRAVDAAALAGAVELPGEGGKVGADARADQFLAANGIEEYDKQTSSASGLMGAYRYTVTVTHPIDLYFLPLVGLDTVTIRDRATAEVNPLVNLYVSQSGKYGQQATVNLSVFGPDSCHWFGDPYSPRSSPWWDEAKGVYYFRLDIPSDYEDRARALTQAWNEDDTNDVLRVEIWDPDSYNSPVSDSRCEDNRRQQPCTPATGNEETPFEFIRIDENRCGCTLPPTYAPGCTTTTRYTLYYFRRRVDGSFERVVIATYEASGVDSATDLLWVSPPGFELEIPEDIYTMPGGIRSLFLDVRTVYGASENGFDLWAGPRYDVPAEVNERNVWIVEHPGGHDSAGVAWFGVGRIPMNSNSAASDVLLTLAYLPPEWEGRTITVSAFDNDYCPPGQPGPGCLVKALTATLDTSPDWQAFIQPSANGVWRDNEITLPGRPDYNFYGGYLQIRYQAASAHDTFGWKVTGEAAPVLVE